MKGLVAIFVVTSICPCFGQSKTKSAVQPYATKSLVDRFQKLSCAIVKLSNSNGEGTGFYVSADGDLVTAAHVVYTRSYSKDSKGLVVANLSFPTLKIVDSGDRSSEISSAALTQTDKDLASSDLALIHTHTAQKCFIQTGDSDDLKIGTHVLAIGHPALSGAAVLFDGFISSRHVHLPVPIGYVGTEPVLAKYDVIRIQMPLLPGASGSPVISDNNEVVGVVSEVPIIWTKDLEELVRKGLVPSGILMNGMDTTKALAQLALVVGSFESPGSGLAVPISYLKKQLSSPKR